MRLLSDTSRRVLTSALSVMLSCSLVLLGWPSPAQAQENAQADKVETVYVKTNADGTVRQVTSKVVLTNNDQSNTLLDKTALDAIESDNAFQLDPNTNELVWQADAKQVQYKGTSTAQPPIVVHATYQLDGVTTAPAQMVGKSGHVTIRYDYQNDLWQNKLIGGALSHVYTPFLVVTTVTLPHDIFSNVSITNGRLNDGASSCMAIGYALPGLQQSLDLSEKDLQIPDHVIIEADVIDFQLESATTIVTPELLKDVDTSTFDTSELSDSMGTLQDAVDALASGSGQLTDALTQLAQGNDQLVDGLSQFSEQAGQLPQATGALTTGANALADGIADAANGATGLAQGAEGVKQLVDGAAQAVDASAAAIDGANQAISQSAASIQEATDQASQLQEQLSAAGDISQTIADLQHLLEDDTLTDEQRQGIQAAVNQLQALAELNLAPVMDATGAASAGLSAAQTALGQDGAQAATSTATELLGQAASAADQVAQGAQGLSEGLGTAKDGASSLAEGAGQLDQTAPALVDGLDALKEGASQLTDGLHASAEGASQLSEGIGQLGHEGIDKLVETVDGDLGSLTDRIEALSDAAGTYDTFSGKAEGATGSVTFIYQTDGIGL